jgi:hypothetical protein
MTLRRSLLALTVTTLAAWTPAFGQTSFTEVTPVDNPYFSTPAEEDFWVNALAPAGSTTTATSTSR